MARPSARSRTQTNLSSLTVPQGIVITQGMTVEGDLRIKSVEDDREKEHRLRMEVRAFWVKEAPVHVTAIAVVVVGTTYAIWALFQPGLPREERDFAVSILSHLLVAVAGFAFGKAAK
jgi:hypothetical protein